MTILLRDDFTGSGAINGRTPDGVNSGAWIPAPMVFGANNTPGAVVSGVGRVQLSSGTGTLGLKQALSGAPAASYVQVQAKPGSNTSTPNEYSVWAGVRWLDTGSLVKGVGMILGAKTSANALVRVVVVNNSVTDLLSGGAAGTQVRVGNPYNYNARLEVEGTAVRLYIDGSLYWSGTQSVVTAGGAAFLGYYQTGGAYSVDVDWVEAGALTAPPAPVIPILDNFDGAAGTILTAHMPDMGGPWTDMSTEANEWPHYLLDGAGGLTTSAGTTGGFEQAWATIDIPDTPEVAVEFELRSTSGTTPLVQTSSGTVFELYTQMGDQTMNVFYEGGVIYLWSGGVGWSDDYAVGSFGAGGASVLFRIEWFVDVVVVSVNDVEVVRYPTVGGETTGAGYTEIDMAKGNTMNMFRVFVPEPETAPVTEPFWTSFVFTREVL